MATDTLDKEFRLPDLPFRHQNDMAAKYDGRGVAIKNREVLGAYDIVLAAYTETIKLRRGHSCSESQRGRTTGKTGRYGYRATALFQLYSQLSWPDPRSHKPVQGF